MSMELRRQFTLAFGGQDPTQQARWIPVFAGMTEGAGMAASGRVAHRLQRATGPLRWVLRLEWGTVAGFEPPAAAQLPILTKQFKVSLRM